MALNQSQKKVAAYLAQKNFQNSEYLTSLSDNQEFALNEIQNNIVSIKEDLLKEKLSHESHINNVLAPRILKIDDLLLAIQVLENVNP